MSITSQKKQKEQHPAGNILTEQACSIKDLLHGKKENTFFLRDTASNREQATWSLFCQPG